MSKRIVLLTIAFIVIFAGIALQYSCTNYNAGIGEEDATGTVETTTTESPVAEKERRATFREIDEMHQRLEEILLNNYDIMNQIVSYLEETPGEYSFGSTDGKIFAWWFSERAYGVPYVDVDLNEIEIAEQIAYVISEFEFISIHEDRGVVWFTMVYHGRYPYSGHYNQGLVCNTNDAGEYKIVEREGPSDRERIRIKDEWFRYHTAYYEDFITS